MATMYLKPACLGDGDPFLGVELLELEFLRPTLPDRVRHGTVAGIGRLAGVADAPGQIGFVVRGQPEMNEHPVLGVAEPLQIFVGGEVARLPFRLRERLHQNPSAGGLGSPSLCDHWASAGWLNSHRENNTAMRNSPHDWVAVRSGLNLFPAGRASVPAAPLPDSPVPAGECHPGTRFRNSSRPASSSFCQFG